MGAQCCLRELNVNQRTTPGAQHHLSKLNVHWCITPQSTLPGTWGRDWDLLHLSHLCPYAFGVPAEQEMGKWRSSLAHRISAIQFSGREYRIAWFTFFLTEPCCSKSIFPPPYHMSVRGGKCRQKKKKKGSTLGLVTGWFLLRLLYLLEAQHLCCSKSHILYTCNSTCTIRFCRLTTSEKTCHVARGCKAASCSDDGCGGVAPWAVFWPTITNREEEKFCRRTALRNCMMLTRQGITY